MLVVTAGLDLDSAPRSIVHTFIEMAEPDRFIDAGGDVRRT
ncbi:hypothetical protein [Nocardia sp. CA-119907]